MFVCGGVSVREYISYGGMSEWVEEGRQGNLPGDCEEEEVEEEEEEEVNAHGRGWVDRGRGRGMHFE